MMGKGCDKGFIRVLGLVLVYKGRLGGDGNVVNMIRDLFCEVGLGGE